MAFDSWTVEGAGVAPLNVHALKVLAPSAVALSRSAVPPRLVSSVPLCMWIELSGRRPPTRICAPCRHSVRCICAPCGRSVTHVSAPCRRSVTRI